MEERDGRRTSTRVSEPRRVAHAGRKKSPRARKVRENEMKKKKKKKERKENCSTDHRLLIKKNSASQHPNSLPRERVAAALSPFCEAAA